MNHIHMQTNRSISKKLDCFLFADDTNIYYESDNLQNLERIVNM